MLNLNSILTFVCVTFFSVVSMAQPLTNGMGIITHWTGFSGEWDAFSIYETENNANATLGQNWATNFNTPEHKFKASFGNTEVVKNLGFNIAYRYSDDYYWEATFGNGIVPEYHVLDAQVSLKVPSFKSTFKAGATNLLGDEYFTAFGTGFIGSMYYVGWTINNL